MVPQSVSQCQYIVHHLVIIAEILLSEEAVVKTDIARNATVYKRVVIPFHNLTRWENGI